MPRFAILSFAVVLVVLSNSGCAMLPVAKSHQESPWHSFDQAKTLFDQIVPYQTTRAELQALQIDPIRTPNIQILSYPDIVQLFFPNSSIKLADLDQGLRDCVAASENCQALQINLQRIVAERHGNVLLDLFRFKRQVHQTGWHFNAVLIMVEDLVVYKIWGGTPKVDEHLYRKNPLGPLQEPADLIRDTAIVNTL